MKNAFFIDRINVINTNMECKILILNFAILHDKITIDLCVCNAKNFPNRITLE